MLATFLLLRYILFLEKKLFVFIPKASIEGVTIRVKSVANARPKATALASKTHQSVEGPPNVICLDAKSIFTLVTIGSKPIIVVIAVNKTGLSLCAPVLRIASVLSNPFFTNILANKGICCISGTNNYYQNELCKNQ